MSKFSKLLHPFEEFKPAYLNRLLHLGRHYLVSQTYFRIGEKDPGSIDARANLLFSDYAEPGEARLHLNAVKHDRYAAIIDLRKADHLGKIRSMMQAGSGYRMYFAVVRSAKELEALVNRTYRERLKKYVEQHTNWRISRDAIVKPTIQLSFGQLYINLRHGHQFIRIKFEEIETD